MKAEAAFTGSDGSGLKSVIMEIDVSIWSLVEKKKAA